MPSCGDGKREREGEGESHVEGTSQVEGASQIEGEREKVAGVSQSEGEREGASQSEGESLFWEDEGENGREVVRVSENMGAHERESKASLLCLPPPPLPSLPILL